MNNTNDYIRRGDAIEAVHDRICQIGYERNTSVLSIRQAVRDVTAADVVERPRWIPVTERLPDDEKDVLAYYGFKHDGVLSDQRFIGTLCYFRFDPNPHWQHEGQGKLTVTHWMPLPEPPEGDV